MLEAVLALACEAARDDGAATDRLEKALSWRAGSISAVVDPGSAGDPAFAAVVAECVEGVADGAAVAGVESTAGSSGAALLSWRLDPDADEFRP